MKRGCEVCGRDHPRCDGHRKHTDPPVPCMRWPKRGVPVCDAHGGRAKQVRDAAARREERAEAERQVATFGLPVDVSPDEALLQELHRTAGHVRWLGELVAALEERDLKQYQSTTFNKQVLLWERPSVWVELYQHERKHLREVASACVKAGIEERRMRLAEEQGARLAEVIKGILTDLDVWGHPDAPAVVRRHMLRVIDGGQAA